MITYKLHKDPQVLEVHYEGDIYLQDLVNFIDELVERKLPKELRSIAFATKADFKFTHSELEPVAEALKRLMGKLHSLKEAFILDTPQAMVLATTFKMLYSATENFKMEIFSTPEAALRWQGIDYL